VWVVVVVVVVVGLLALASSAATQKGMQQGGNARTGHSLFEMGGMECLVTSFCMVVYVGMCAAFGL